MSLPPVGICCGGRWIGTTTVPVLTTGGSGRRIRSTTSLARVNSMLRSLSLAQAGPKAGLDIATAKAAREISTLVVISCLLLSDVPYERPHVRDDGGPADFPDHWVQKHFGSSRPPSGG